MFFCVLPLSGIGYIRYCFVNLLEQSKYKVLILPNTLYDFFKIFFSGGGGNTINMDKTQYSKALQNAVAYLKGQKILKKEIEISMKTGFSKGSVSNYLTGSQTPSVNFIDKFQEVYNLNLEDFKKEVPVQINNSDAAAMEAIIRTEAWARTNASYIAEIYGHLMKVPATKVLREMVQMSEADSLKSLEELKGR